MDQMRVKNSHVGVSKNRGTPTSSILVGFSIINHPFWGTPIFWKHPCGTQKMMIFQDFCIHFIPLISRQEGGRYRRRGKEAKTEAARRVFRDFFFDDFGVNGCYWVVVEKYFYFYPYLGKIPILTNMFGMG